MSEIASQPKVALVIGLGDSTGGAIAKRFAKKVLSPVTRRSADKLQPLVDSIRAEGGQAFGYASDARKEEDDGDAVHANRGRAWPGGGRAGRFNIGTGVPCSILDETAHVNISKSGRWPVLAAS